METAITIMLLFTTWQLFILIGENIKKKKLVEIKILQSQRNILLSISKTYRD